MFVFRANMWCGGWDSVEFIELKKENRQLRQRQQHTKHNNVSHSTTEKGSGPESVVTAKECGNRDTKRMDREDRAKSASEGESEKRKGTM